MTPEDVVTAMGPVATILEELNVPYYIGGSLASSAHGLPRATNDVDIVAALQLADVELFVARLQADYYIDAAMMRDAIRWRRSFNLVHLETGLKVDVFAPRDRPADKQALARRREQVFEAEPFELSFWVAAPEDVVLSKFEWFRMSGGTSDRQWNDILGVFKMQREDLDFEYLQHWAQELNVTDLLERALDESGLAG